MSTLSDQVETNAAKPKRVQGDAATVEQHPLPDQIEAAKFQANVANRARTGFPVRRQLMRPPGPGPDG